jgi:hypothetical protein
MSSGGVLAERRVPSLRLHGLANSFLNLGRRRSAVVALVIYATLAILLFSSTWVHPMSWSIGVVGDPQQLMWFLGWSPFALTHGQSPIFTDYIDYPGGVNLMWNASLLMPATALGPLTQLAGFVLSYNAMMTGAVALSAWTAYLLIRRYVSSQAAAAVGGALYGFSPFMTAHSLGHSQLTLAFIPPILLLLLDEIVRVQRRRPYVSGLMLGVAAAAQLLTGEELLAISALLGVLLLCLAAAMRPDQVRPHLRHAVISLVSAASVFLVLVAVPLGFQFFGPQHIAGAAHTANVYVNDALSFIVPTKLMLVAPPSAVALSDRFSGNAVEASSYLGVLLVLLLVLITVRYWQRLEVRLAALTSVLISILSMGITIHFAGKNTPIPAFVLGVGFLLVQRNLAGLLMAFLTFVGWLAMSRLPVLNNILPARLMLVVYLLAGLLIAVWLDDIKAWRPRPAGARSAVPSEPRNHPGIFRRRRGLPNSGRKHCPLDSFLNLRRRARHDLAGTGGHALSDAGGLRVHP